MADVGAQGPGEPQEKQENGVPVIDAKARLIEAEAELAEAQTKLAKARTPLVDRVIMRGLIPLALAIVGPWALYTFSVEQDATNAAIKEIDKSVASQAELTANLQKLVADAEAYRQEKVKEEAAWRERMKKLEQEKAIEIATLSSMVVKLNQTLKIALLNMAIERTAQADYTRALVGALASGAGPKSAGGNPPTRRDWLDRVKKDKERYVEQAVRQVQFPDQEQDDDEVRELKEMAGEAFDRYIQQEQQQAQTDRP